MIAHGLAQFKSSLNHSLFVLSILNISIPFGLHLHLARVNLYLVILSSEFIPNLSLINF